MSHQARQLGLLLSIIGIHIGVAAAQLPNNANDRPNIMIVNETGSEATTRFAMMITMVCVMMGMAWYCRRLGEDDARKQMESEMVRLRMEISAYQQTENRGTRKHAKSIAVQSQTSYTWWRQQGRFVPLPERSHGAFSS